MGLCGLGYVVNPVSVVKEECSVPTRDKGGPWTSRGEPESSEAGGDSNSMSPLLNCTTRGISLSFYFLICKRSPTTSWGLREGNDIVCAKHQAPEAFNAERLIWLLFYFLILLTIQSHWWVFDLRPQISNKLLTPKPSIPGQWTGFLAYEANTSAVAQVTGPRKTQGDKSPLQQSPKRRNKLIKLPNGEGRVDLLLISLLLYYPFEKHPLTEITNWRLCGGKAHLSITVVTLPHLSF